MVGPLLERLGLDLVTTYWTPDGELPRPRAQPAAGGEPRASSSTRSATTGADLGIAWDGDADRCFFIDDTRPLRRRRLPDRDPGRAPAGQVRARRRRRSSTTCAPRARCPTRSTRAGGSALRQPRRPRVLQDAHARRGRDLRRRGLRATTTSTTSTTPTRGRSRRCSCSRSCRVEGRRMSELLEPLPRRATSSRARSTPRSPTGRPDGRDRGALRRRRRDLAPRRRLVDYDDWHFNVRPSNTEPLLRLCLESLVSEAGHGAPARRGARASIRARDPRPRRPDAVRRRAGQLLPRRGRPAHARRLRARTPPRRSTRSRARCRARPPRRGPRADRRHPPAHGPHRARRDPRAALGRGGLRAGPARALARATTARHATGTTRSRRRSCAATASREERRHGAARGVRGVPRLGRGRRRSPARWPTGRAALRRPDVARAPPPRALALGHRLPRRGSAASSSAATTCIAHISSNPLISRPLGGPATPRAGRRRSSTYMDVAARDARDGGRARAARPRRRRSPTTSRSSTSARACTSAARTSSTRLIAERPRTALRAGPGDVGQRRADPGLPDAQRGARPRRPAARRGRVVEEAGDGVVRYRATAG